MCSKYIRVYSTIKKKVHGVFPCNIWIQKCCVLDTEILHFCHLVYFKNKYIKYKIENPDAVVSLLLHTVFEFIYFSC